MKKSLVALSVGATVLLAALVTSVTVAQAPESAPQSAPQAATAAQPAVRHVHREPTNLKVLPKTLTGEQVHDIMEQWEGSLGTGCGTCHTPDPNNLAPNGKPRLNFPDDSKPEKQIARQMYLMTEYINMNYIAKIESSGAPVTCGTCHRGHLGPQPFIIPDDDHDHPQPQQGSKPAESSAPRPK